ncbi:hypothetical protein P3T37_003098 [Kitasatospora sp. MAA4]|nr:hypothetical protein [Kitasatospora sp. MAA4]MDH6133700.1 hypothetical protein [Kitasatospora sp. MAA4]
MARFPLKATTWSLGAATAATAVDGGSSRAWRAGDAVTAAVD